MNIKKTIDCIFVFFAFGVLFAGLVKTVWFPKDINYYENRPAEHVVAPTYNTYVDSSFQNQFEKGLMDQIPFSQKFKKLYNLINSNYLKFTIQPILENNPDRYISYNGNRIFGIDYITYAPYDFDLIKDDLNRKIDSYNRVFAKHPDVDFYTYYIEKDTDINFETNEKLKAYEYLENHINLPKSHITNFTINDFETFSKYFYKTDHHWNHKGAYLAYTQIVDLLGVDEPYMTPEEEVNLPYMLSGSKAAGTGSTAFNEPFTAYKFQYPTMNVQIDGEVVDKYGDEDAFFSNEPESISYGSFYGWDNGEIIFDTNQPQKENLLIIGESYDNAILKLLASHFNRTYSIDLRNNNTFKLSEYLKEHDISKVLLIGNVDYFIMEEFMLED